MNVTGGVSDDHDIARDEPVGGISSSWGWFEEAGDDDCSSVNTKARGE